MSRATKFLALAAPLLAGLFAGTAVGDALPYHARAMASVGVELPVADRVLVRKSERRLYLMRGDDVLRAYRVALGLNPGGAKERAGDFRTPEGSYRLTRRNTRSDFFLSIQVSYPNDQDMLRARRNGWQPGGSIMIHGLPNDPRHTPDYYASQDWTDGCIAVTNADMVEIWMMTADNVRIDIQP
ncbi:MAG TPA: L,D-transpeptidase family protein [Steroidobacteraceae bacterium]|jgi:murein L,D-transpeptidase YafK|nr:L,D-transpeptidase family protein [Steroidobacteraceae bacterium]